MSHSLGPIFLSSQCSTPILMIMHLCALHNNSTVCIRSCTRKRICAQFEPTLTDTFIKSRATYHRLFLCTNSNSDLFQAKRKRKIFDKWRPAPGHGAFELKGTRVSETGKNQHRCDLFTSRLVEDLKTEELKKKSFHTKDNNKK